MLFDLATIFGHEGNLLPVKDWPAEAHSAVASVKVLTRQAPAGDGAVVTVADVKLWDKVRALELLATYFGLLKKQVEHSGRDRPSKAAASCQAERQAGIAVRRPPCARSTR